MDKKGFIDYISRKICILDGATGTELQKRNMPAGVCPEKWVLDNPKILQELQKEYIAAGSRIISACTFGGNRAKLDEFGLGDQTISINSSLVKLSKEVAGHECYVTGDIGPTGRFIEPLGDMSFEECVSIYKEQVEGLLEGGVDLFFIETMMDIQEARAALLAVKESCDLPVCVSMSFDESRKTLTGTDPVTALITFQSMGADVVGCNCSTGPLQMLDIISLMKPYARVPLFAKPNAGLPRLINGTTVFDLDAEEFGTYAEAFVKAGVSLLGGCCGTSPEHIRVISTRCMNLAPISVKAKPISAVTSLRKTVFLRKETATTIVGERINPTGKKKLQDELKQGIFAEVRKFATEQVEKGADILDINVGMPGIDEKAVMIDIINLLGNICDAPLCLDSASPEVLEASLRIYPGRALINSISQEKVKLEKLLPIAAKYGAMFILLPLSDEGVPQNAEDRIKIVNAVYTQAARYGYLKNDIIVDGLVMSVSSNQSSALETLKLIEWCSKEFGCSTVVGLSNVSFGLPERSWINAAFLALAIDRGLTMAIANPSSDLLINIKMACDVLTMKDSNSSSYISHFSKEKTIAVLDDQKTQSGKSIDESLYEAVLKGNKEKITALIDLALDEKMHPRNIVDVCLIPAINQVGVFYNEKKYFLPQLIQSAEAMRTGFEYIAPLLKEKGADDIKNDKIIVLATVKGDIHDIGKNIVGLMLKNYGFNVYDLGKDVSAEKIVLEAKKLGAHIIGLSALMTTTMIEMKEVIRHAREENLLCRFMIGGAVVDKNYADEIGADGYSKDAYEAVQLANKLMSMSKQIN